MLQAQSNTGSLVILAKHSRKEIEYFRRTKSFFCPACQGPVIIKAGRKIIPHFAHHTLRDCPTFERGEGVYHEKGKLLLYEWLKLQGLNVTLEKYIKEIKQRSDLFVTIDQKQIAIEYQCARVNIEQIHKRTKGYEQAGITPIWILGANLFQRRSSKTIKIDRFSKSFIHQFSPECLPTLYYFCPTTKLFVLFQDIYFSSRQNAFGNPRFFSLQNILFKELFRYETLSKQFLLQSWENEKKRFRLTRPKKLYGQEKLWHNWLYHRGTHRELLPSIIYLPVKMQIQMNSSLWNWQSRLYIDFIEKRPIGSEFTLSNCEQFLRKHRQLQLNYPLMKSKTSPLREYLYLLQQLQIVQEYKPDHYVKQKSVKFHKHIEDALNSDKLVISELIRMSQSNFKHNQVDVRYNKQDQ